MERKPLKRFAGLIATALVALVLVGCKGADGRNGADGANGTNGTTPTPSVPVTAMSDDQWVNFQPTISVIGTPTVAATGPLTVTFEVKDASGNRVTGLDQWTTLSAAKNTRVTPNTYAFYPSYSNFSFTLAKLIPEDAASKAPSKWINYFVTTVPAKLALADKTATAPMTLGRPSNDNQGTLVQNADGTYTYTFRRDLASLLTTYNNFTDAAPSLKADLGSAADLTFDGAKIHRLVIQFYGNKRGTGSNTADGTTTTAAVAMANPVNYFYDWVPATKAVVAPADTTQREIVATAKCQECHDKLGTTTPHGGRVDTRFCVVCHNDQRKFGYALPTAGTTTTYTGATNKFAIDATTTMAAGDMPVMVHKIHMGDELTKTGYGYAYSSPTSPGIQFETLGYPMGRDMCSKCHSGAAGDTSATAQGENWNLKPSRKACGACHDDVDWTAPHPASATTAQTNDAACAGCHVSDPASPVNIKVAHYTNNVNLTPHNPVVKAGLVNFKYEIAAVTQATSGGAATVKFRILSDGGVAGAPFTPVTNLVAATTPVPTQILPGFTGSPAILLAWAMPQEGVTTGMVDYNNLNAAGTAPLAANHQPTSINISALLDTANATTTGTLSGPDGSGYYTANIVAAKAFPAGAKLRSAALQAYFTQVSPAAPRHAIAAYGYVSGESRRKVVDSDKCSNCHEWFEGHGGNRVKEVQVCVMCHVPGLTTSGKGMDDTRLSAWWNYYWDPASPTHGPLATIAKEKASLTAWTGISFATNPVTAGNTNVALNFPQVTNNLKDMIHGIHAGKTRTTNPFKVVRDRTNATTANGAINVIDGAGLTFPGILNSCTDCHTYNGYSGVPANTFASRDQALNVAGNTTTTLAKAALGSLNAGDLMTTPFTASCVSCHDSVAAGAHMKLNGGQISVARSTLNTAGESCAVCHGAGSTYDPVVVHK